MTKTLTEQWREGKLDNGFYYVRSGWSKSVETRYLGNGFFEGNIEVLASVPTYAEFKDLMSNLEYIDKYRELLIKTDQLEKKLEIATKALKKLTRNCNKWEIAREALKEMEGVK